MNGVTPDQLITTAYVTLAILAAIVTVDKVVDIVKKWRTPATDTAKKLATDKARLDDHDKAIHELQDGQKVLCSGLLALLDHELHNGNTEQMQKARNDIMTYLQEKIAK